MTCRPRLPSKYQHQTLFLTNFSIVLLMYLTLELFAQKYCIISSLLLFWCPYMVINVSVIQCNGGLLPDIILLTLSDSFREPF